MAIQLSTLGGDPKLPFSTGPQPVNTPSVPVPQNVNVRSRVVTLRDSNATSAFAAVPDVVENMVGNGMLKFTGRASVAEAWRSLVGPDDRIGIKVYTGPGRLSGTRLPVVAGVVKGLIASGISPTNIVVWDRHLRDMEQAGYRELVERFGVRLAGSSESGYDEAAFYEAAVLGRLIWGDLEFQRSAEKVSRKSFLTRILTRETTRLISIHPLMNHNALGVYGHVYGLAMNSVDNSLRFENNPTLLADAVPEIFAQKEISDRVVLNITDALLCQFEGEQRSLLHYTIPLNELRFSRDPVALDALSLQEIDRHRPGRPQLGRKAVQQFLENSTLLELGNFESGQMDLETYQ